MLVGIVGPWFVPVCGPMKAALEPLHTIAAVSLNILSNKYLYEPLMTNWLIIGQAYPRQLLHQARGSDSASAEADRPRALCIQPHTSRDASGTYQIQPAKQNEQARKGGKKAFWAK
ncbi:hypothetical protein D8B26_000570 [Coccidioides posadasii str. Silveira]|uniref:uncharacterized protein n=1 Tax=Coccidioides posadasii (strain RMSCC 757 / Silveira) TaxID=443226 RepID=UPI001BEF0C57|nr:hypothetical protein D8B26_000570 [Coccidioides posadasii str. Silveira]